MQRGGIEAAIARLKRNPSWDPDIDLLIQYSETVLNINVYYFLIKHDEKLSKMLDAFGKQWADLNDVAQAKAVYSTLMHELANEGLAFRKTRKALGF